MSIDWDATRKAVAERVAKSAVRAAFKERTGHGGGLAAERHLRPDQLEVMILACLKLYEEETTPAALPRHAGGA